MLLPLFPLPSRPTELIQFRQPNIADAMRFNSITPEEQEQQTTAYLKALLAEPAKHDPLTWTAQDRITALWWIFTGSRETPVETFTYTCKHCGKEHYYDCDMNALAEDIQVLEVEPFIDDIEVSVEGVPYQWRIVPLDGWAMEMLEMRRAALPPEDDAEFKEAIVDLRFWEFAYQCELYNDVSLDKKALAALKDAVDLVRQSKESGQHITDVIAQGDMFSETAPEVKALALFIVANNRSAKRMATAFKLMAQRINDELQHQGQALGDMFGGGDVSLQDILRQVSQELENEGMQGISGGLFESVSGGSYNGVAPYTSLLLHRASGIKDIIHLIRLLSRTDPHDEQLVQVLAHFVRMPVADVKKWCRLFGISNSLLRGLLNHASSLGRDGFDEIAQAIKNGDMPPAIDWFSIRPTRVKAFLSAAHSASSLAEMVQRLSLIFTDHTALGDLTLDEMKDASIQWADQQNEVNSDFLTAFRKAVSKADDARGILKAFKALQSRVNKHVGDIDGVTAEGRDILKEHGITPEFIDEIRTDMQREVVSSLQIVARALADANPKSAAIVNRVIGDIEASEGMGVLKLFLSRAFNPNGNILPGIIGEAKKYVSEEELEQLDQLLKRFSYNPQTRWQMNQRSMGSVHEKVLSAMNSAIANSYVSEEKALEWADSFITEEVEEVRAGQNGGIDLRKELADIYRLTGGKISTLSKVVHHQGRAYANLNGVVAVNLNDENASALWHELGHHLEYSNPGLLEKARSFLKANVEGDKPSFVNIGGRGKPEWCFRSRLSNIYMAKVYPPASVSNTGKIRQKSPTISKTSATEVFSMALQLYHDKEAAAASLMNGDGLLELLLGVAKELNNAD